MAGWQRRRSTPSNLSPLPHATLAWTGRQRRHADATARDDLLDWGTRCAWARRGPRGRPRHGRARGADAEALEAEGEGLSTSRKQRASVWPACRRATIAVRRATSALERSSQRVAFQTQANAGTTGTPHAELEPAPHAHPNHRPELAQRTEPARRCYFLSGFAAATISPVTALTSWASGASGIRILNCPWLYT